MDNVVRVRLIQVNAAARSDDHWSAILDVSIGDGPWMQRTLTVGDALEIVAPGPEELNRAIEERLRADAERLRSGLDAYEAKGGVW